MLVVRCTTPLWWGEDTRCGESVGHPLGASVGEMVATQPRSGAAMINFREHRQGEVLGIHLPRTLINSEEASCFSWACLAQRSSPSPDREGTSQGATRCAHRRPKERHKKEFPLGGFTSETANASSTVEWGAAIQLRMMTHHLAEAYSKIVLLQNGVQSEDRLTSKGCCDGSLPRQAVSAADAPW